MLFFGIGHQVLFDFYIICINYFVSKLKFKIRRRDKIRQLIKKT